MILHEVERLADRYDLVLLEGFKRLPCRKVWLLKDSETTAPEEAGPVERLLAWDADRISIFETLLSRFLEGLIRTAPVFGCVLIGGRSERMGRAKHLLPHFEDAEHTWLHHTVTVLQSHCEHVVIAGSGSVPEDLQNLPRLADSPDVRGPMAGLLAAMRWSPKANWLLAACDMPRLSDEAVQWILAQRRPFAWALLPQLTASKRIEPLFAWYGSRCRSAIEAIAASDCPAPKKLAQHPRAQVVAVPTSIAGAWSDADTPEAALPFTSIPVTESLDFEQH